MPRPDSGSARINLNLLPLSNRECKKRDAPKRSVARAHQSPP
jgi:hypothetical protein